MRAPLRRGSSRSGTDVAPTPYDSLCAQWVVEVSAAPSLNECGLIEADADGAITFVSPLVSEWTGSTLDELRGVPLRSVVEARLHLTGREGAQPADAVVRTRTGAAIPVVVGALPTESGTRMVLFDVSPTSAFGSGFAVARARSRRGTERLRILLGSSVGFADARTEDAAAQLLAEVARRSYGASDVTVHLQRSEELVLVAGSNPLGPFWQPGDIPTGARTLVAGEVLVVRSPQDADVYADGVDMTQIFRSAGIGAALAAPIIFDGEPIGSFICFFDHERDFDDEAVPLAEALANQAAQAITRIRLEERLRRIAMLDELTGLPTRRLVEAEVTQKLAAHAGRLAVLFVDLDGFKRVNDTLGHAAGDDLLRLVAARLRSTVREVDVVGRFGGDEFMVVAAVHNDDEALALADRIRSSLVEPYADLPGGLFVSASVGLVVAEPGDVVVDRLLRLADHAMYEAKAAGGNRVVLLPAG